MQIYYFLPVLLIGAAFAYSFWVRRQAMSAAENMSPEEAAERFHQAYAGYFDLEEGEKVVGAFSGLEFQGAKGAAQRLAGDALNSASAALIGVSTYVPNMHVGLTSSGRVLVSREYSELGKRGHFEQIVALGPGAQALGGAALSRTDAGPAPKNPFNPAVGLEFVELRSSDAEKSYAVWLSPQGGQVGHPGFRSILQALSAGA